jgi:TonB family protein
MPENDIPEDLAGFQGIQLQSRAMKTFFAFCTVLMLLMSIDAQQPPANPKAIPPKADAKNGRMVRLEKEPLGDPVPTKSSVLYERPDLAPKPADTPENSPQAVRVSQGVSQALIKNKVEPAYPAEALKARTQGAVVLAALIDYDGKIQTLRLVSGHPMLVPAAVDAVKHWEYKPYYLNGHAIQVDTQITVNFTLSQ